MQCAQVFQRSTMVYGKRLRLNKCFKFYDLLNAMPSSVIELIQGPELTNAAENRVYNYLLSLVGNMK